MGWVAVNSTVAVAFAVACSACGVTDAAVLLPGILQAESTSITVVSIEKNRKKIVRIFPLE